MLHDYFYNVFLLMHFILRWVSQNCIAFCTHTNIGPYMTFICNIKTQFAHLSAKIKKNRVFFQISSFKQQWKSLWHLKKKVYCEQGLPLNKYLTPTLSIDINSSHKFNSKLPVYHGFWWIWAYTKAWCEMGKIWGPCVKTLSPANYTLKIWFFKI